MTLDCSIFAATSTAIALVSSRDEEGTGQGSWLLSNFFLFIFPVQRAVKLMMKPKFLVLNFDMIEPMKYIIVASRGRLSVHCVAGLGELQLFWSHRTPKSFKNPHNTSEKNVTKKLPMNISNLLAIL